MNKKLYYFSIFLLCADILGIIVALVFAVLDTENMVEWIWWVITLLLGLPSSFRLIKRTKVDKTGDGTASHKTGDGLREP